MATKVLNSIKGRTMRITRLDACGAPVIGDCSTIVTNGFITVTYAQEWEAGDAFYKKNAWGEPCVNERDPDVSKWTNVTAAMCKVHPDVLDIIANGAPVNDGTDTVGSTFGSTPNTEAFALEVWTKQIGVCSTGSPEWGYFCTPFVRNGKIDGSIDIALASLTVSVMGMAFDATDDWGVNPYGDNPMLAVGGFPAGEQFGIVTTTVQPPAETAGCVALAA